MRYFYIKDGDAVDQVRRIAAGQVDRSGPDAFICDFILSHANDDLLVAGVWDARDRFSFGRVRAEGYNNVSRIGLRRLKRLWIALRVFFLVWRWKPDRIVCACTEEALASCVLVAKVLGVPIVQSLHNELQRRGGPWRLIASLDRASIRACDAAVCHGPFLAAEIKSLGVPARLVHDFEVDLSGFAAAATNAKLPPQFEAFAARHPLILLFSGRVQQNKGVFDLLEAFRSLVAAGDEQLGLVYIGSGSDLEPLRQRVAELSFGDRVLVAGKLTHAELPGVMSIAAVTVTPTRPEFPEGRCMVVIESLVLGVPVVAPDNGPFPYAIQNDVNGYLYEPGNVEALRAALARIIREPQVRARLRQGSLVSRDQLLTKQKTFSDAVEAAFVAAKAERR